MTTETTTLPSTLFRGIYIPLPNWTPPAITEPLLGKAKAKREAEDEKGIAKYAGNAALALGLDDLVEGMTRDGKPIKPADLFLAMLDGQMEAEALAEVRRKEAEAARNLHKAKMEKVGKLEAEMKAAIAANPEAVTYTVMKGWADLAKEHEAFLVFHGGEGEGSGPALRFKGAAREASGEPRAPRATGGGSQGGKETRVSAYAEAKRFQKKGGAPHDISRTGEKGSYKFFDHGKALDGPLSRYLQTTYPTAPVTASLKGYDERRKAAKAASV